MPGFDANNYFLRRMNVGLDKIQALEEARTEKLQALQQYAGQLNQRHIERQKSLDNSVVGMLDLDPDGVAGTLFNEAVRGGAALSKASGMVGSGIWDLIGAAANQHMPEEVKAARKRQLDGTDTEHDKYLLSLPAGDTIAKNYPKTADYETNAERIQRMESAFSNAKDIRSFFDLSDRVYQGDMQRLQSDIKDDSHEYVTQAEQGLKQLKEDQYLDGLSSLASGVKGSVGTAMEAGVNNPKAVVESLIDQAPNLAAAAVGVIPGTIYNALYGLNTFGEGVQEKIKKGKGAMLSDAELADSAQYGALASAAEIAGDKLMGITGVLKGAGKTAAKAGEGAVEGAARQTLKERLLGLPKAIAKSGTVQVGKAAVKGGVGEYLTEGAQTSLEAAAKGNEATLEEMNLGASMGLLTGAPMSGVTTAIGEVGKSVNKAMATATVNALKQKAKQEARNNPDALLDPAAPTYDPATGAEVLHREAMSPDASEDAKTSNLAKLAKTEQALKLDREAAFLQTPEGIEATKQQIVSLQEEAKAETDPKMVQAYTEMIGEYQASIDAFGSLDEQTKTQAAEKVKTLDQQLAKVSTLHADLVKQRDRGVDVASAVTLANTPVAQADETTKAASAKAVGTLINLSMRNPERVTPEMAKSLARNKDNALSREQREYLMHHAVYQEAVASRKKLPKVHMEILEGDPAKGQLGLKQYRERVEAAVREGNSREASRALNMLNKFMVGHNKKLQFFSSVFDQVKGTRDKSVQVIPGKGKGWIISPNQSMSKAELEAAGGLRIHGGSKIMLDMIRTELKAMHASVNALQLVQSMAFNSTTAAQSSSKLPEVTSVNQSVPSQAAVNTQAQSSKSAQSTTASNQSKVDSTVNPKTESTQSAPLPSAPTPNPGIVQQDGSKEAKAEPKVRKQPRHPRERDDLVGAILRVTDDKGIHTDFLHDTVYDDLKNAGRAKKAFSPEGHPELDTVAQRLFNEENYGDGTVDTLVSLLQSQVTNNVRDNNKMQELAAKAKHKADVSEANQRAEEAGVKGVRGRRTIAHVDADIQALDWAREQDAKEFIAAVEAAIASNEVANIDEAIEQLNQGVSQNEETSQAQSNESPVVTQRSQSQPTAESTGSNKGTPEVEAGEAVDGNTEDGKLSALNGETSPEGTPLRQRSKLGTMVADFFTQSSKGSKRPLVAMKDFLSKLKEDPSLALKFIGQKDPLTANQETALKTFIQAAASWSKAIQKNLAQRGEKDAEYLYKDMAQFFQIDGENGAKDFEENLKTAIAYAAFSWVVEAGYRPEGNTPEQINKMLNRSEHDPVTAEEAEQLFDMNARLNTAINSMGDRVIKALGIKTKPNAPLDALPKLSAQMGGHVFALLDSANMVTTKKIGRNDGTQVEDIFVGLVRDHKVVTRIIESTNGSKGILDTLFAPGSGVTWPSLVPQKFSQLVTKTGQRVPAVLAAILQKDNNQEHRLREDLWNLWDSFSDDAIVRMAGGIRFDPEVHQVSNKKAMTAKWNALHRDLRNLREFVQFHLQKDGRDYSTPFFFNHDVWQQQRVGIEENGVNPQMSKIHRVAMFRNSWVTKIDMNKEKEMNNFRLRVMEGLGENTGNNLNKDSLLSFNEMVETPVFKAAIDALVKKLNGETLSQADKDAIEQGVAKGDGGMHSLDALMAMAQYRWAESQGHKTFTTRLAGEIDGVTNGPILAHLFLGAANSVQALKRFLNRGGIYFKDDAYIQYNQWRGDKTANNYDLYENMTAVSTQYLNQLNQKNPVVQAVQALIGDIGSTETGITSAGRNLSKAPVRPMIFGSSAFRAIESMGESFTNGILKKFEKIVGAPEADQVALIKQVNTLLGEEAHIALNTRGKGFLKIQLTPKQRKAINQSFQNTFGKAFKEALKDELGSFIELRDHVTMQSELMSRMYSATYDAVKQAYIERLAAKGQVEVGKDGKPLHDLNAKQQKTLERLMSKIKPVVHTPSSLASGNIEEGIPMFKMERQLSQEAKNREEVLLSREGKESTLFIHSLERIMASIGVSAMPFLTQASDSAISHTANAEGNNLNTHDANVMGLATFEQGGRNLNKATWETALAYSPLMEMYNTMGRTVMGIAEMLQSNNVPPKIKERLAESLLEYAENNEIDPKDIVQTMVTRLFGTAYQAEVTRLQAMLEMTSADQYSSEGAAYLVTDADRQAVQAKLDALSSKMDATLESKLRLVNNMLNPVMQRVIEQRQEKAKLENAKNRVKMLSPIQAMQLLEGVVTRNLLTPELNELARAVRNTIREKAQSLNEIKTPRGFTKEQYDQLLNQLALFKEQITQNAWGAISNTPVVHNSNQKLLEVFESRGRLTGEQLVKVLKNIYGNQASDSAKFQLALLERITPLLSKDLTIRYVTSSLDASLVNAKPLSGSKGWYTVTTDGKEEIYVLGKEYVHSAVNEELMLHELTHAAVAKLIEQELQKKEANPDYTSDAYQVIEQLMNVQAAVREYYGDRNEIIQYEDAFNDLQEFVAWGLTNKGFQDAMAKVTVIKGSYVSRFANAAKEFFNHIASLLFGKAAPEGSATVSALQAFMEHSAELFEAAATTTVEGFTPVNQAQRAHYTTIELFNALGANQNPGFQEHLRGLLGGIVTRLQGQYGSFTEARMAVAQAPDAIWRAAQQDGIASFAAQATLHGFPMSEQESFVMDQVATTVQAALADPESRVSMGYRELKQLYREVYGALANDGSDFHSGDWATATPAEKQAAKGMYNFIFKMNNGPDGKSDFLARFAAMGLANEKFHQVLMMATQKANQPANQSFLERLQSWLNAAVEMFVGKVTHTYKGQRVNAKLEALIDRLVYQQEKRNGQHDTIIDKGLETLEQKTAGMSSSLRATMGKIGSSGFFKNSGNGYVQATGAVISAVAGQRFSMLMEAAARMYTSQVSEKNNFFSEAVRELINNPEQAINLLRRGNKHLESVRKEHIDGMAQIILESFQDGGKYLTEAMHQGVSAYLRVDISQLLDDYAMDDIHRLVNSTADLDREIELVKAKLAFLPQLTQNMVIGSAHGLGYFNATGKVHNQMLYKNAQQISQLAGSRHSKSIPVADQPKVERIVDTLATLYGMKYVDGLQRSAAKEVFRIEQQRGNESGIEMVLRTHKHLIEKSRSDLFSSNENLMMKGYLPEIYDPHRQIVVADDIDGRDLVERGWIRGDDVAVDPADPDQTKRALYYVEYGAKQGYNTGALGLKGRRAKGSRAATNEVDSFDTWRANETDMRVMTQRKRDMSDVQNPNFDPSRVRKDHAAPVFDNQGRIDKYNYIMNQKSKDTLLDRENRFDHLLGALAGSIFDKSTVNDQNRTVINALYEQYRKDYSERSNEYVEIGINATEARYREMYELLPKDTKDAIREIWASDSLLIRADLVYSVFGFRDPSISKLFSEDYKAKGQLDKLVINLGNFALGKKAEIKLAHYEDIWQAFVQEAKDMIVIRTFSVLKNNVLSNESVLLLAGLSVGESIKHQITAFNGARDYKRDSSRLNKLRHQMRTGLVQGSRAEILREMQELEDALANNPVKPLIDAGLMPTIVEDVVTDEDRYSYRTKAKQYLASKTEWVNPKITKAAKFVYMDKDTQLYQAMYYATQLSDFMARYALYKHYTTRKHNVMSHEEAIEKAAKVFVEYDIPSHPYLEYANKVGAVRFTKYYMRIQRVIFDLYHENPARALAMLVMGQSMEGLPLLSESSMLMNPHSPMSIGAFEYARSFDDLATVKLGNALLK